MSSYCVSSNEKNIHILSIKSYPLLDTLPGQVLPLAQDCSFALSPMHSFPPFKGAGLSHLLLLFCVPFPQVTEHAVQDDHLLQLPWTTKRKNLFIQCMLKFLHILWISCYSSWSDSEKSVNYLLLDNLKKKIFILSSFCNCHIINKNFLNYCWDSLLI